jgi:hypothetical protein
LLLKPLDLTPRTHRLLLRWTDGVWKVMARGVAADIHTIGLEVERDLTWEWPPR